MRTSWKSARGDNSLLDGSARIALEIPLMRLPNRFPSVLQQLLIILPSAASRHPSVRSQLNTPLFAPIIETTTRHANIHPATRFGSAPLLRNQQVVPLMTDRRVGLWLVGAFGGVGTTVTLGLAGMTHGLVPTTGLVTALGMFEELGLPAPRRLRHRRARYPPRLVRGSGRGVSRQTRAYSTPPLISSL